MKWIKHLISNIKSDVWGYYHRHPLLTRIVIILGITYAVIRIFFTPALLSDVHFGNAYYDRNGELLRITLSPDEKYRLFTPLDEISPHLVNATILYEDKYFYYHIGINPVSLAKATINYLTHRPHPAGASTITMQVARLKYNLETTHPLGKLTQIAAAIYIDAFYSKRDILTAYLNLAPYGGNIESIGAASVIYFNKPAANLSKIESITLATVPQNPTKRGLNTDAGLNNIMNMRRDLISRWVVRYPDDIALNTMADMPLAVRRTPELPFYAPHFINHENANHRTQWNKLNSHQPTTVQTTLDIKLQNRINKRLQSEIAHRRGTGITNAAVILLNYKTMDVLAHIGSADYFDKTIYGENDGVYARRSPGSTLKPLIYAQAVDMGLIHGMTLLKDAKINFGVYAPENSDSEFYGPVLARDALTHSRNIPAINLVRQIGVRNFYKLLTDCGVANLKTPAYYGISVALGGAEVTMAELASIYATMANLGLHQDIRTDAHAQRTSGTQLLSPEAFFITLDMLGRTAIPKTNIPFARNQTSPLRHYWKTGTSSSFRDAWTAGIFGDFVLIVWVGNFDGTPNNAFSGARAAAPIYFAIADTVREYYESIGIPVRNNNFLRPEMNISQIEMCDIVGGIAGAHCPRPVLSYFIPAKSPIDVSSVYREIPIDNETGLRACNTNPDTTHMAVYEFWDAEYLDMFKRAGIKRNTPPPFLPNCDLDAISQSATPPVIQSPSNNDKVIILNNTDSIDVSFQAICESPTSKLFWFLDDDIIGTTTSGQTLLYPAKMGQHRVRVVDELGTGQSITFTVIK